ncbi:MAG: leucine-rich repeat domain-containing protein [Bacteroidaceae bacterium]|nr:leucine-rich repeat domain-containing protein [Bacteroidaceae bacterium]
MKLYSYDFKVNGIYYKVNSDGKSLSVSPENFSGNTYSGDIIVPSDVEYDGASYKVTGVGLYSFYNCEKLTSVTLPSSIKTISSYAFASSAELTEISLSDGIEEFGDYAFSGCISLESLYLPTSLTKIGNSCFSSCESIKSLVIPENVSQIGASTFEGCNSLTSLAVDTHNPVFDSRSDCNSIIETSTKTLIFGCQSSTIPFGIDSIANYAFNHCVGLTSIDIPVSASKLGDYVFANCANLTTVKLSSFTTHIPFGMCWNCYALSEISIPEGVTSVGDMAFSGCRNLSAIDIPESVETIGWASFSNCANLRYLRFPDGIKRISTSAFAGCSSLTDIVMPGSSATISGSVFEDSPLSLIFSSASTPSKLSYLTFSDHTYASSLVLIPHGCASGYEKSNYWKKFTNYKEYISHLADASSSQAYNLLSVDSLTFLSASPSSTIPLPLHSSAYDASDAGQSWCVVELGGKQYIINLGTKGFLSSDCEELSVPDLQDNLLSSSATNILCKDGNRGIMIGSKEYYLVENDNIVVPDDLSGYITHMSDVSQDKLYITSIYDLTGAEISTFKPGINIVRYSDGSVRKIRL